MRLAVVSDIHGNRHAFEAVLAEIDGAGVEQTWCLGDLVGYGAEPDACVALARSHTDVCLAGNHDLAVLGELSIDDFSQGAASAARWTREHIAPESLEYLAALEPQRLDQAVGLFHASPRDAVWEYVLSTGQAQDCLDMQDHRVCLVGHSHVALSFTRAAGEPATGEARGAGEGVDVAEHDWLLNPGAVGQPRDGDPRAAWLLLDTDGWQAEWRRTEYDIAGAAAAIRAAKLPDSLAERLRYGQ
jgi:diadenosine tetraphosphatase ApaH/serine/threonine PP2A family protein phosphatase